jgi:ferredoxin-NADP reductase
MKVFFKRREELAPTIWQYYFRPERPVDFVPGQYIDLQLPDVENDPRGKSRVFTLTSLPNDPVHSFVVKIAEPASLYKQRLTTLEPGYEARVGDAMGDLVLPKSPDIPLVFAGGGIGIASFVSMAKALDVPRNITLFYALRDTQEQIFTDVLATLQPSLRIAPERLSAAEMTIDQSEETLYYLSGSQNFVEGLRRDLQGENVSHDRIVFDYYDGYAEL